MFYNQVTYSPGGGSGPRSVAVVDVNSDNIPDIVTANTNTHNVGVLLNAGNGTFLSATTFSTSAFSGPRSVAVVDVNNDNKPDIVTANPGTNNVGVLFGVGNGTFLAVTTYSSGGTSAPQSLTVVDVNSDNRPDIITANTNANNVGVLLNAGNGTFLTVATYSTGGTSAPQSVAVVDVNGDNKPDIIVANPSASNVGVLLGVGNGTFLAQTTFSTATSSSPQSVVVVDVSGDNKPDIIVANQGTNSVGVLLGIGNGTFRAQTIYTATSSAPRGVTVGDVNGDNKPDIVVANSGTTNVGVLLGVGNGTFLAQTPYTTGTSPRSVAVGDVNGDNKLDIVVGNQGSSTASVLLHC